MQFLGYKFNDIACDVLVPVQGQVRRQLLWQPIDQEMENDGDGRGLRLYGQHEVVVPGCKRYASHRPKTEVDKYGGRLGEVEDRDEQRCIDMVEDRGEQR